MAKRSALSEYVDNPFIKRQNRQWEIALPSSLRASVSPPRSGSIQNTPKEPIIAASEQAVSTAEVEAGKAQVHDHLTYFVKRLSQAMRPIETSISRLSIEDFVSLYQRNLHPHGRHFVVHQHDHPVAGTHYDLRLQCNATSSISFAIMYGLPGNPNSRHLNRNAAETRVHNIWVCCGCQSCLFVDQFVPFRCLSLVSRC